MRRFFAGVAALLVACSAQGGGGGTPNVGGESYSVMAAAQGRSDTGASEACVGTASLSVDGATSASVTIRTTGVACAFSGRRVGDVVTLDPAQLCVVTPRRVTLRMTLQSGQVRFTGAGVAVTLNGRYERIGDGEMGAWEISATGVRGS